MEEGKKSPLQRALLNECDHVIRKADILLADMHSFYNEMGWEWPAERSTDGDKMPEVSRH